MSRADLVVISGGSPAERDQTRRLVRAHAPQAVLVEVELKLSGWRTAGSAPPVLEPAPPRTPALVVTGIATPQRFASTLTRFAPELEVRDHLMFDDHHRFRRRDRAQVLASARRVGARCIVSTEKDEPRLLDVWSGELPLWIAVADLDVLSGGADLDAALAGVAGIESTRGRAARP
jgi:tetraacyldisaccharide-1-P 4'-kinase